MDWQQTGRALWKNFANRSFVFAMDAKLPLTAIASIDELSKGVSYYEDQNGKLWVNKKRKRTAEVYRTDPHAVWTTLPLKASRLEFHNKGYSVQMISDARGGLWLATREKVVCRIRQDRFFPACSRPRACLRLIRAVLFC